MPDQRIIIDASAGSLTGNEVVPLVLVGSPVTAGSFVIGTAYSILSVGTTDFTAIGAASNTVGVGFVATGAGSGTGTAGPTSNVRTTTQAIANLGGGGSGAYGSSTKVSANNTSANIQITGIAAASGYELIISNLRPGTDSVSGILQFGIGGTPTWITANYSWTWHLVDNVSNHSIGGSDSDSSIHLLPASLSQSEIFGVSGKYIITDAGDSSHYAISGHHAGRVSYTGTDHGFLGHSGGVATLGGALTAIRFTTSSGNWQTGFISLIPLTL